MKKVEKILVIIYLLALIYKMLSFFMNNLIFTGVSMIIFLFYLFGSWYFLNIPYNKLKLVVISVFMGFVLSAAFNSILFNIQHWKGGINLFYLSEIFLIISLPLVFILKNFITDKVKKLLLIRYIALIIINFIAFIMQ